MSNYYSQSQYSSSSRSPPPLQHPVPTHPAFPPIPPSTPSSPDGYMRFTSTPPQNAPLATGSVSMHNVNLQSANPNASYNPNPGSNPNLNASQAQMHGQSPYMAGPYGGAGIAGLPHAQAQFQGSPVGVMSPNMQQGVPGMPGIDFTNLGFNPAAAQLGMQLGQSAVAAGQDYVQKNFGGRISVPLLKHHFNVSNSYVINKIYLILVPWWHKRWNRDNRPTEQGQTQYLPPRDDVNSPDLYIPVMALVTYILLAGLHSGLQDRFHPEVLGIVASRALAIVFIEFLFIKAGCYFLNITGSSQVTDLVAYGGYKFVGVIATFIIGLLGLGGYVYILAFFYFFFATGFFLLRALKYVILPDPRDTTESMGRLSAAQRSRRIWFLFAVAASQILYMGILVRV